MKAWASSRRSIARCSSSPSPGTSAGRRIGRGRRYGWGRGRGGGLGRDRPCRFGNRIRRNRLGLLLEGGEDHLEDLLGPGLLRVVALDRGLDGRGRPGGGPLARGGSMRFTILSV